MNKLLNSFNEYFEVIPTDTPELLEQAFRLRYRSYCIEDRVPDFEAEKYPDGLEFDKYDQRSVQCLLRQKEMGFLVGVVRLVLHDPDNEEALFPVEEYAGQYFDDNVFQRQDLPRSRTAEISRLCILSEYRLRKDELNSLYGNIDGLRHSGKDRRQFPHPILGLMVAIMRMSVQNGITHWYAGMDPKLNKRLSMLGLDLTRIGPIVSYHGQRRPYIGVIEKVMKIAYASHRDIWGLLTDEGSIYPVPYDVNDMLSNNGRN